MIRRWRVGRLHHNAGQASIMSIGILVGVIMLAMSLVVVSRYYVDQAELQQAADVSAMARATGSGDESLQRVRQLAQRNGASSVRVATDASGAERITVRAPAPTVLGYMGVGQLEASAEVPWIPDSGGSASGHASGGMYSGPLVRVDAALICPRVAAGYRAMQRSAAMSGVSIWAVSGYRTIAQQAVLYAQLGPGLAAPPGTSLHHAATEFDLAVGAAGSPTHSWLTMHASTFGFIQRYSWEPWHWGNVRGC